MTLLASLTNATHTLCMCACVSLARVQPTVLHAYIHHCHCNNCSLIEMTRKLDLALRASESGNNSAYNRLRCTHRTHRVQQRKCVFSLDYARKKMATVISIRKWTFNWNQIRCTQRRTNTIIRVIRRWFGARHFQRGYFASDSSLQ